MCTKFTEIRMQYWKEFSRPYFLRNVLDLVAHEPITANVFKHVISIFTADKMLCWLQIIAAILFNSTHSHVERSLKKFI